MNAESVGKLILDNRKKLKMTQMELANQIGVTDKAVSKWERGIGLPDINIIEPLAVALKISVVELITGEEKSELQCSEYEDEMLKESLKSSLVYAQIKIKNAISYCIPSLILSWVILLLGVCLIFFTITEIWIRGIAILLLITSTQLSGKVLLELIKQSK